MIEVINTIQIPVSKLVANNGQIDGIPKNPRFIRNERFDKLVKSIQDHPEFLGARELIVYKQGDKYIVLCGNMRYRASKELNIDQLPCKVIPDTYTIEQIKAIIIKDNISFGSDDVDALANEWDVADLVDWGYEFTNFESENDITENNDEIDLKDLSNSINNLYRIEVICKDEEHQENIYNKLIEQGYECRLLTL